VKPDDTRPLTDMDEVTPELRSAVQGLQLRVADREQMSKLAARLGALGVAVAPAVAVLKTPAALHSGSRFVKLLRAKLFLVGALVPIGVALIAYLRFAGHVVPHSSSASTSAFVRPETSITQPTPVVSPPPSKLGASELDSQPSLPEAPVQPQALPQEATRTPGVAPRQAESGADRRSARGSSNAQRDEGERTRMARSDPTSTLEPSQQASNQPSDVELLQQARALLGTSPAEALTIAREHGTRFPSSAFAQEREMIAITALVRLGRHQEAQARAEHFRRTYPTSAHLRQLEKLAPAR
jgi:hypothetical protein